jgi:flagellar protein FliL
VLKDKKILAGGAVLFVAAFWFYIKPNYMDAKVPVVYTEEQIAASPRPTVILGKASADGHGSAAAPDGLILNLKAPAGAPNYVKAIIALEFQQPTPPWVGVSGASLVAKNAEFAHHLDPEMHKILDSVSTVFASKSVDDISTVEGREHLKAELAEAINHHLHDLFVETIYFETFITQ